MAYLAAAGPFHACGTAPAPMVSGQLHCDGLPNPRGPKDQQHAGSFFMSGSHASQRLGSYRLTVQEAYDKLNRRPHKRLGFRTPYEAHCSEVLYLI